MANNAIGISAGIDTKPLKDALKDIDVNVEKIAQSMDAMVMSLQTGFDKTAKAASKAGEETKKAFKAESFLGVDKAIKDLNTAFASGDIKKYKEQALELMKTLEKVSYQADVTGKKVKTPSALGYTDISKIRKAEMPANQLQALNIPQLQQALLVTENSIQRLGKSNKGLQQPLVDNLNLIKETLKYSTMSSDQLGEYIGKERERLQKINQERESLITKRTETGGIDYTKQIEEQQKIEIKKEEQAKKELSRQEALQAKKLENDRKELSRYENLEIQKALADKKRAEEIVKNLQIQQEAERKTANDYINWWNKAINEREKKEDRLKEEKYQAKISTYGGALDMSDKSISQRIAKTQALIKVRQNLSSEDANYSQKLRTVNQELFKLDLANKQAVASGVNLQSQSSKLSNTFDSLYRRMAYYLSVGFAINFVQKMAAVRGEFELQQRSLQAIIQNKDEADKVFAKITALAVKSPFQLRELVGYTKQLAAYRIETEKLYDTTKMLADVSAGLGVDMGRLILAYGQVKSAAVLRGQELRQFTEAGIPIIQALADKFTELNGRVVSTGEVFELVSNRMVSFKMVDEIFKDMTQSGGIFYNMQEIQAETLKGKISNLNDAFDIMLNKMGTEYEGALKGSVDVVRYLLENYEGLLTVIKSLAIGFGSFALVLKAQNSLLKINVISTGALEIRQIALALRTKGVAAANIAAANSTTLLGKTMGKLVANPYIAIAAALAGLITYLISAANEANKLQKELKEITSESFSRADELVRNFKKLANTIKDAADGTQKQKDALAELKRTYSEYLPYQSLTVDGLRKMAKGYKEVEEAIYAKIKATDLEKQTTLITETLQPKITEAELNLQKKLKESYKLSEGEAKATVFRIKEFMADNEDFFNTSLVGGISIGKGGKVAEDKARELAKKIADVISVETGKENIDISKLLGELYVTQDFEKLYGINKEIVSLYQNIKKLEKGIGDAETTNERAFSNIGDYIKDIKKLEKEIEDAIKIMPQGDLGAFEFNESKSKVAIDKYSYFLNQQIAEIGKKTKLKMPTLDEVFEFSGKITKAPAQIQEGLQALVDTPKLMNVFNDIQTKIIKLSGEKSLINMKRVFVEISESIGMSMDDVTGFLKDSEVGFDEWSERIIASYDSSEKEIKQYQKILDDTKNIDDEAALSARALTEERINGSKLQLKFLDQVIIKYGIERKERSKDNGKDETEERLKNQIALIKEVMKAWKQSFDVYGNQMKANEIVTNRFKEQWEHIIPDEFSMDLLMGVDIDTSAIGGLVESLMKGVSDKARQYGKQEQNQIVFDASIDLGEKKLKEFQMELENSLKGYELSVSLEGYGAFGGMVATMFEVKPQDFATTISTLEDLNQKIMDNTSLDANQRLTLSKKVDDEIAKLQKDNYDRTFKGYNDLLSKYAQYEFRRIKIAEESAKERENIEASYQQNMINDIQKEQLLEAVNKKEKTETAKVSFEEFKGSDTWIQAFDELGNASAATLNAMMQKMEQFRTTAGKDLDPTQLREYMNTFKKLREEIIERDPFKALGVNIRAANKAQKELQIEMGKDKFKGTAEEYVGKATQENLDIENQLTENLRKQFEISAQIQALKENELPSDYTDEVNQKEEVLELIRQQNIDLEATQSKNRNIIDLSNQMTTGWNNASKAGERVGSILKTTMSSVKGLADVFGMETDSMSADMLDLGDVLIEQSMAMLSIMDDIKSSTTKAISDVGDTVDAASEGMKSSADVAIFTLKTVEGASVILAVISAALQVATAIANLFVGNKDKKLAKKQKESEGRVIALKNAYDLLDRAISRAFGDDSIAKIGQQTDMLVRQQNELKKQIQLEKDKKKTDKDKVKELEQQLMELNQAITDSLMNMRDQILGIGVIDVANDLGDALKEAFMTGEESAMDWGAKTKEIVANMVYQMLVAKYLAPKIAAEIDKFWEKQMPKAAEAEKRAKEVEDLDLKISEAEGKGYKKDYINNLKKQRDAAILARDKAIKLAEDEIPNVTEQAAEGLKNGLEGSITSFENLVPEWTKDWLKEIGGAEDKLSGLQKGIQGITEKTAEALESLLNTIRFEIFTHTTLLSQIANNINMNSAVSSQLVLYASQSYNVLLQMRAWQQSITAPSHKNGGDGLKVFIN